MPRQHPLKAFYAPCCKGVIDVAEEYTVCRICGTLPIAMIVICLYLLTSLTQVFPLFSIAT